jgi:hypothetical protein
MRKSIWAPLLVIIVLILLTFVVGRFFYYSSSANAYTPPTDRELTDVNIEDFARSERLEAPDNPTVSHGVVVVDYAHSNAFFIEELNVLLSRIVSRGFSYEVAMTGGSSEDGQGLVDRLRYAKALILPLGRVEYTPEEVVAIEDFVRKGGRVLIIGDPTRTVIVEALNTIAGSFGVVYVNDYLYSLENNDNNYRNVVYTNFNDSPITEGLEEGDKVIFYGGGSIVAPGNEIIEGDETTYSSTSEGGRAMAAAALTTDGQVLALGDMTFFVEPYSNAESNGILINNIANFLTGGERRFELKDFPHFFNSQVNVVFDDSLVFNSQFEDSVQLKSLLEQNERTVNFTDQVDSSNDVIFIGRFKDAETVQSYLDEAGITLVQRTVEEELAEEEELVETEETTATTEVSDTPLDEDLDADFVEGRVQIKGVGELEMGGSTLFSLHEEGGRNVLIILSDNPETNADAFELLIEGMFTDCMAGPFVAVCQTEEPNKQQAPSVRSDRIDKILVVADDNGRQREDEETGVVEFVNVLSDTYKTDTWFTGDGDELTLDELQEYDAIIWATGDYWDDSIDDQEAELLTEYVDAGGNLILSGASIAFDWDHTDFLENIVHADYLTVAEQTDLEVALVDHPIAKGFAEGDTIDFVDPPSGEDLDIDVVNHTPNSRVVFQRGSDSRQAGAASVIAYEDDRSKVAYYAFPFYLLPADAQERLAENTIDWFTRKPLELPAEKDYQPFEQGEEDTTESDESETAPDCDDVVEDDPEGDGADDTDGDLDDDGIADCTPEDESGDTGDEGDNGEGDNGDEGEGDTGDEGDNGEGDNGGEGGEDDTGGAGG